MNIQSGRNPIRRPQSVPTAGSSPMSKLKPAFFFICMIIMVAGVCELHIYFKSRISALAQEIDATKRNISHTKLELKNLRNKIEERNRWSYIRYQINRFGIKLKRPEPGQMHNVSLLPARTVRIAAEHMERQAMIRAAMVSSNQRRVKISGRRTAVR